MHNGHYPRKRDEPLAALHVHYSGRRSKTIPVRSASAPVDKPERISHTKTTHSREYAHMRALEGQRGAVPTVQPAAQGNAPVWKRMTANEGIKRMAYTPAEIAASAGLSRKAIYRAIENGELRAAKVCNGSRLLIPSEAAREWIERHVVGARKSSSPRRRSQNSKLDTSRVLSQALNALDGTGSES